MGSRAFRTVRYRGRYYLLYNRFNSYPTGLEKEVQAEILTEPVAYAIWLTEERDRYEILAKKLEEYLIVRYYNVGEEPQESSHSAARSQMDSRDHDNENLLGYTPVNLRYPDAQWDSVVGFDLEVFTINNSAHMKLDRIPKHGWIQALVEAARGNLIILPGLVAKGCVADLLGNVEPTSVKTFNLYDRLAVNIVSSKGIDIPLSQRHGPHLSTRIFVMFQQT